MEKLQSLEQFKNLTEIGKSIFLFSADWCPDCRVIEPFMDEVENTYEAYSFIYIDRDQFLDLCVEHDIYGIPSFLAFEDGKEIGRYVSKDRKTRQEIELFIQSLS